LIPDEFIRKDNKAKTNLLQRDIEAYGWLEQLNRNLRYIDLFSEIDAVDLKNRPTYLEYLADESVALFLSIPMIAARPSHRAIVRGDRRRPFPSLRRRLFRGRRDGRRVRHRTA
jgi:hypothetical protein